MREFVDLALGAGGVRGQVRFDSLSAEGQFWGLVAEARKTLVASCELQEGRWVGFPRVVCLCGSTRFKEAFLRAQEARTLAGEVVLTVGCFPHTDLGGSPEDVLGEDVKRRLDVLHKHKVLMADYVYVLNVGGYVGSSTRSEIDFALANGKPVEYLEAPDEEA
jgi:hypothetical protein